MTIIKKNEKTHFRVKILGQGQIKLKNVYKTMSLIHSENVGPLELFEQNKVKLKNCPPSPF